MAYAREHNLTLLVIVESLELFIIAPLAAKASVSLVLFLAIFVTTIGVALAVVWHMRVAMFSVACASGIEAVALGLRIMRTSGGTEALDLAAALVLLVTLTTVLSVVVFGPGRVTIHRILGAIAIYLNVAAAFTLAYRMIDALGPGYFSSPSLLENGQTLAAMIYFSFTTLTTTGFGDIVPVDPLVRSLSNLEAVIGHFFRRRCSLVSSHSRSSTGAARGHRHGCGLV